jgi:hypothetical protein
LPYEAHAVACASSAAIKPGGTTKLEWSEQLNGKKTLILLGAALVFTLIVSFVLTNELRRRETRPSQAPAESARLEGQLRIQAVDDLRVAGRRIILCGVSYQKPSGMRSLVLDNMRREFAGSKVVCTQVGAGTPCDGRSPARFNGVPVMQCFIGDADLAAELSRTGALCDSPSLSGGAYKAC